jgi:hypothetical protein
VSATIQTALDNWVEVGQPALNDLLSAFWEADTVLDPKMKVLVFAVLGGYTSSFSQVWKDTLDVHEAHGRSVNEVMSNPAVSNLVNNVMSDMVQKQVKGMI